MRDDIVNMEAKLDPADGSLVVAFDAPEIPSRVIVGTYIPDEDRRFPTKVFEPRTVCQYVPDMMHTYFDENDVEHDTDEADPDGCHCSCDKCGNPMTTGELGWFDERPGEHGGIVYIPTFNYCPGCGAKVLGRARHAGI